LISFFSFVFFSFDKQDYLHIRINKKKQYSLPTEIRYLLQQQSILVDYGSSNCFSFEVCYYKGLHISTRKKCANSIYKNFYVKTTAGRFFLIEELFSINQTAYAYSLEIEVKNRLLANDFYKQKYFIPYYYTVAKIEKPTIITISEIDNLCIFIRKSSTGLQFDSIIEPFLCTK
jgi:hypothetical protein